MEYRRGSCFLSVPQKSDAARPWHGEVGDHVDDLPPPKVVVERRLVIGIEQRLEFLRLREGVVFLEDVLGDAGDVEVGRKHLAERLGFAALEFHRFAGVEPARLEHLPDSLRRIGRDNRQRVARAIFQPGAGKAQLEVKRLLVRAFLVEQHAPLECGGKRVFLVVNHSRRGGHDD